MNKLEKRNLTRKLSTLTRARYESARRKLHPLHEAECDAVVNLHDDAPLVIRELFAALRGDNCPVIDPHDGTAVSRLSELIHDSARNLPAWESLVNTCRGNSVAAANAAGVIWDEVSRNTDMPELPCEEFTDAEREQELGDWADWVQETLSEGDSSESMEIKAAIQAAVEQAGERSEQIVRAMGNGFDESKGEPCEAAWKLPAQLKANPLLRSIVDRLGGMRRALRNVHRKRPVEGNVSPYSVKTGDDLGALLPDELAGFADPDPVRSVRHIERYLNAQTLQYAMKSRKKVNRGAFIVLLDASGSMRTRMGQAVSFAAAAVEIANEQKRPVHLIAFNSSCSYRTNYGSINESVEERRLDTLLFLSRIQARGGTNFQAALSGVLGSKEQRADVLLISDGNGQVDEGMVKITFDSDRRLHYLVLGPESGVNPLLKQAATTFVNAREITDGAAVTQAVMAARGTFKGGKS